VCRYSDTYAVTRNIVGYKKEESDAILKFLYDHIAYGADFQTRVKWAEGTVVVWDNRVTGHSAILDWVNVCIREENFER
jgi:sulfonate dioxygenase